MGGGWGPSFWLFKSLGNNMVYSSSIDVYVHTRNHCRTKVLWVLKFGEVGGWGTLIPNSPYVGRFLFIRAKLYFLRGWVLFLVNFLRLFRDFHIFCLGLVLKVFIYKIKVYFKI